MTHPGSPGSDQGTLPTFRSDFAVIVCDHVFSDSRPVLLVVRDEETSWQFLCGADADADDCHSVGVGHLLSNDGTLGQMAALPVGFCAERKAVSESWEMSSLDA